MLLVTDFRTSVPADQAHYCHVYWRPLLVLVIWLVVLIKLCFIIAYTFLLYLTKYSKTLTDSFFELWIRPEVQFYRRQTGSLKRDQKRESYN